MLDDALKVVAAVVLAIVGIAGITHCAHADYILQLVVGEGDDTEVIDVDIYKHRSQCEMVKNQYRLGAAVYGQALAQPIREQVCVDCDEFDVCREGI